MKYQFLAVILNVFFTIAFSINQQNSRSSSSSSNNNEIYLINLDPIELNEELEPNILVFNLTKLIADNKISAKHNLPSKLFDEIKSLKVKFFQNEKFIEQQDYFKLDQFQTNGNILLKTNAKRIDREHFCRTDGFCSCEYECKINLNFMIYDFIDDKQKYDILFKLPVLINDINDNVPAFYQEKIFIDIDLDQVSHSLLNDEDSFEMNDKDESANDLIKIPLKLGYDLDSTAKNRINSYQLFHLRKLDSNALRLEYDNDLNLVFVKYDIQPQNSKSSDLDLSSQFGQLNIFLNKSESVKDLIRNHLMSKLPAMNATNEFDNQVNLMERFKLKASDPNFESYQEIMINFKISLKSNGQPKEIINASPDNINNNNLNVKVSSSFLFEKNFYNLTHLNFFNDEDDEFEPQMPTFKINIKTFDDIESKGCALDTLKYEIISNDFDSKLFYIDSKDTSGSFEMIKNNYLSLKLLKYTENDLYQFKLQASCLNKFSSTENKQNSLLKDTALIICQTKNVNLEDLIKISTVSSLNGLETKAINKEEFEFVFNNLTNLVKLLNAEQINQTDLSKSNLALGYIIMNVDEMSFKAKYLNDYSLPSYKLHVDAKIYDDKKYSKFNIFRFEQLRNGLLAIKLNAKKFELFKNSLLIDLLADKSLKNVHFKYEVLLSLKKNQTNNNIPHQQQQTNSKRNKFPLIMLKKKLNLVFPAKLIQEKYGQSDLALESDPLSNLENGFNSIISLATSTNKSHPSSFGSLNIFNSFIVITTASIMLILFGLVCCVVSLSLYVTSRCKARKDSNLMKNSNIMKGNSSLIIGDCDSERNYSTNQQPTSPLSTTQQQRQQKYFYANANFINSNTLSVSSETNNSMNRNDSFSDDHYLKPTKIGKLHITKKEITTEISSVSGRLNHKDDILSNSFSSSGSSIKTNSNSHDSSNDIMVYDIMPPNKNHNLQANSAAIIHQNMIANSATASFSLIGFNHHHHHNYNHNQQQQKSLQPDKYCLTSNNDLLPAANNVSPSTTATTFTECTSGCVSGTSCESIRQYDSNDRFSKLYLEENALLQTNLNDIVLPLSVRSMTRSQLMENLKTCSDKTSTSSPESTISSRTKTEKKTAYDFLISAHDQQRSSYLPPDCSEETKEDNNNKANNYRNEIFRNSHILFKNNSGYVAQQKMQQSMKISKNYRNTHQILEDLPISLDSTCYLKVKTKTSSTNNNTTTATTTATSATTPYSNNESSRNEFISPSSSSAISSASSSSSSNDLIKNIENSNLSTYQAKPICLKQTSKINSNNNKATKARDQDDDADDEDAKNSYRNELFDLKKCITNTNDINQIISGIDCFLPLSEKAKSPTNSSSSGYSGSFQNVSKDQKKGFMNYTGNAISTSHDLVENSSEKIINSNQISSV